MSLSDSRRSASNCPEIPVSHRIKERNVARVMNPTP